VTRTVFPTTPQRVDYELTKLGSTLWEAVEPLSLWARAHVGEILTSRKQFDEDAAKLKSVHTRQRIGETQYRQVVRTTLPKGRSSTR
jgi:hypothetical protein